MTTDDTKQNPTEEIEHENEADLDEEKLGQIDGGIGIGPFSDLIHPRVPRRPVEEPEEPKDGGATGSW